MTRVVLITGGTKGLGAALTREFLDENTEVVALFRQDHHSAGALQKELQKHPGKLHILRHDITKKGLNADSLPDADEWVVIHNAGATFEPRPWHQSSADDYRRLFEVAVPGAVNTVRPLLRKLLQARKATVVTVISQALHSPIPKGFSPYVAAKQALVGFTRSLAAEFGERGLRVMTVAPGFLDTPLTQNWNPHLREAILGAGPNVELADVAHAIGSLVQDDACPATGETYTLSGETVADEVEV